jgi:hypothetical protein
MQPRFQGAGPFGVEQFAAAFNRVRVLVASRTYAYQQQDWKLNGFADIAQSKLVEVLMHLKQNPNVRPCR